MLIGSDAYSGLSVARSLSVKYQFLCRHFINSGSVIGSGYTNLQNHRRG